LLEKLPLLPTATLLATAGDIGGGSGNWLLDGVERRLSVGGGGGRGLMARPALAMPAFVSGESLLTRAAVESVAAPWVPKLPRMGVRLPSDDREMGACGGNKVKKGYSKL
jgi:hypothetical protein